MCPSAFVRGRRVRFASVSGVSAHAATVGIVTSRRHLPTWNTIGTFTPGEIPVSVNFPCVSDRAMAAGAPDGWPQRSHVMPSAICCQRRRRRVDADVVERQDTRGIVDGPADRRHADAAGAAAARRSAAPRRRCRHATTRSRGCSCHAAGAGRTAGAAGTAGAGRSAGPPARSAVTARSSGSRRAATSAAHARAAACSRSRNAAGSRAAARSRRAGRPRSAAGPCGAAARSRAPAVAEAPPRPAPPDTPPPPPTPPVPPVPPLPLPPQAETNTTPSSANVQ